MTVRASAVNPDILRWARERSGIVIDEAAALMNKPVKVIVAWESGSAAPTYRQLQKLATSLYHRPIAIFFFSQLPEEEEIQGEFRTLSLHTLQMLAPDTLYALREARSRQLSLEELSIGIGEQKIPINRSYTATSSESVVRVAEGLRKLLGVSLERQQRWRNSEQAFKQWRSAIEEHSIFIFKRPFKQEDISGFCLAHDRFPVIVINNKTAFTRQVFTLFHELAHLIYGVSGITFRTQDYLNSMNPKSAGVEIACNRFASEFLVPESKFPYQKIDLHDLDSSILAVARIFKVSREVILRRLLDSGLINSAIYREKAKTWNKYYFRTGRSSDGGSYYATQGVYLSQRFMSLAFFQYHTGRVSVGDLSSHLGIRAKNMERFENTLLSGM